MPRPPLPEGPAAGDGRGTSGAGPAALPEAALVSFAHAAADALVVCDRAGDIVYWNEAATRLFGWAPADVLGRSLDVIIPERQRARHWEGFHAAVARGTTRYAEQLLQVPALHRDGQVRSVAFTVTLLADEDGTFRWIAALLRDETEARRRRLELEARVRELSG